MQAQASREIPATMYRLEPGPVASRPTARAAAAAFTPQLVESLPLACSPLIADRFAQEVVDMIDGPVLRYSRRLALLRRAEQLRISRFEANLIIAVVQRELGSGVPEAEKPAGGIAAPLTLFLLLQAAILALAWYVWVG
jgi:hypothetical protein